MINNEIMYSAFEDEITALADSYDIESMPEHRFSWRYKRRKRAIMRAYRRSLAKPVDFVTEYKHISFRQRIRFAVIITIAAIVATGAGVYVTHLIGGIMANQQSTHSDAFAADWENAPKTLEKKYRISYNLSNYSKTILLDEDFEYWETYNNGDDYINFIIATKEIYQSIRLNTEGTVLKKRYINGLEAMYFTTNDGSQCLIWDNGEYIFELVFNIDYDVAIQIAETIVYM